MLATRSAVAVALLAYALPALADAPLINLPSSLKLTTETVALTGVGWKDTEFSAAEFNGLRSLPDTAVTFASAKTSGGGQFTLTGPAMATPLTVTCDMARAVTEFHVETFAPMPGAFNCHFEADGTPVPGRFVIQQNKVPIGTHETRVMQRGEIELNGVAMQVRSVHLITSSRYRTAAPLGYLFEVDGKPVGAVTLDKVPTLMLPTGDPNLRLTVMTGAVALSLMWVNQAEQGPFRY